MTERFETDDQVLASLEVRLLGCQQLVCGPTWAPADRWWADAFGRLYWPRAGGGWVEHHGRRFHLRPGVLSLIPAQTIARYQCPDMMLLDWLHFTATVLHRVELFSYFTVPYEVSIDDTVWMDRQWDDFLARVKTGGPGARVAQEGFVRLMLALFLDHGQAARPQALRGAAQFRTVLEYIDQHIAEKLPLARLAGVAHLHPGYFSMQFTRAMGVGPAAYVNQRRIECAKRLLRETTDTLDVIATAVGCGDACYFSRLFKRLAGMTPGEYRRLAAVSHP